MVSEIRVSRAFHQTLVENRLDGDGLFQKPTRQVVPLPDLRQSNRNVDLSVRAHLGVARPTHRTRRSGFGQLYCSSVGSENPPASAAVTDIRDRPLQIALIIYTLGSREHPNAHLPPINYERSYPKCSVPSNDTVRKGIVA